MPVLPKRNSIRGAIAKLRDSSAELVLSASLLLRPLNKERLSRLMRPRASTNSRSSTASTSPRPLKEMNDELRSPSSMYITLRSDAFIDPVTRPAWRLIRIAGDTSKMKSLLALASAPTLSV